MFGLFLSFFYAVFLVFFISFRFSKTNFFLRFFWVFFSFYAVSFFFGAFSKIGIFNQGFFLVFLRKPFSVLALFFVFEIFTFFVSTFFGCFLLRFLDGSFWCFLFISDFKKLAFFNILVVVFLFFLSFSFLFGVLFHYFLWCFYFFASFLNTFFCFFRFSFCVFAGVFSFVIQFVSFLCAAFFYFSIRCS